MMAPSTLLLIPVLLSCLFGLPRASPGDADPVYQTCVKQCGTTGCVGNSCVKHCNLTFGKNSSNGRWYLEEPLYVKWKRWECESDCRYRCMISREDERRELGYKPLKYHEKWPYKHLHGVQEPVPVALSALTLAAHFHGWVSFFFLAHCKLPYGPSKRPFYEYGGLWHGYTFFAMNAWFWSIVFHTRDVELTEMLDYSSALVFVGYSLFAAIVRCFNVRAEAARVMVGAPILAFMVTHILFLNLYEYNHELNTNVCMLVAVLEISMWAVWGGVTRHPSRCKLWSIVLGGSPSMIFMILDFPPYWGFIDAHAIWHATMAPLTHQWWSFVRDDCEYRTAILTKKQSNAVGD